MEVYRFIAFLDRCYLFHGYINLPTDLLSLSPTYLAKQKSFRVSSILSVLSLSGWIVKVDCQETKRLSYVGRGSFFHGMLFYRTDLSF